MLSPESPNPAVAMPPAGSIHTNTEGDRGGGIGCSPLATRAASLTSAAQLAAVVDVPDSRPPWRSWASVSGGGGWALKQVTGLEAGAAADEPAFYHCQICLDDRPAEAGYVLAACGHKFCRSCLKAYVISKVNDAEVYPTCFHVTGESHPTGVGRARDGTAETPRQGRARARGGSDVGRGGEGRRGGGGGGDGQGKRRESCGVAVKPSDIRELLKADEATSRKYARFLFSRENKTARECPKCGRLSVGDPSRMPEVRCGGRGGCGAVFCYEHGGAHEGRTCAEYVESTADETRRTMALIGRLTKPCPGCQTPVEKLGGCNQMVCVHCNSSFCWICMEQVDRGTFPVHFQWWNVRGCPNQQLQEDSQQSAGGRRCLLALSVLQIIVIGPFAVVLTAVSSLACLCCLPAFNLPPRQLLTECVSGWGNLVMLLPLLPVVCAGVVLLGLLYLIMLPFWLSAAISRKYRRMRARIRTPGNSSVRSTSGGTNGSTSTRSTSTRGTSTRSTSVGQTGAAGIGAFGADAEGGSSAEVGSTSGTEGIDVESGRRVVVSRVSSSETSVTLTALSSLATLAESFGGHQSQRLDGRAEQQQRQEGQEGQEEEEAAGRGAGGPMATGGRADGEGGTQVRSATSGLISSLADEEAPVASDAAALGPKRADDQGGAIDAPGCRQSRVLTQAQVSSSMPPGGAEAVASAV